MATIVLVPGENSLKRKFFSAHDVLHERSVDGFLLQFLVVFLRGRSFQDDSVFVLRILYQYYHPQGCIEINFCMDEQLLFVGLSRDRCACLDLVWILRDGVPGDLIR